MSGRLCRHHLAQCVHRIPLHLERQAKRVRPTAFLHQTTSRRIGGRRRLGRHILGNKVPAANPHNMRGNQLRTRPTRGGYVVVDVETSGTDPTTDRVLSIAALTVSSDGTVSHILHSLLDAGVDPGPTNIHGLTPAMLTGQPHFLDIVPTLHQQLRGRILVAHNVAFDYAFLAAEAHRMNVTLPIDAVLCTVELSHRLHLDIDSLSLSSLARHWGVAQTNPHDALDDARVLADILNHSLRRAELLHIPLPLRAPRTLRRPSFAN